MDWFARDWLGHALCDSAYLWMLPQVPLPSPVTYTALTYRPRLWWLMRYLCLAGNGIPVTDVRPSLTEYS